MASARNPEAMNTLAPIALVQSTDLMRRSVRASGAAGTARDGVDGFDGADRADRADRAAPPRRAAGERGGLMALLRRRPGPRVAAAQSGSDQCSMVAAPRKPARA